MSRPTVQCVKRMQQELRKIIEEEEKVTSENGFLMTARPDERNILKWYYVVDGPKDTPYEGGRYVGKLEFPFNYPFGPPSIMMLTPSGRFSTNTRLCLNISDFHPEDWNPMWNVHTIVAGVVSFMTSNQYTNGSVEATDEARRKFARESHAYNVKFVPQLSKLFPKLYASEVERLELQDEVAPGRHVPQVVSPTSVATSAAPAERLGASSTELTPGVSGCTPPAEPSGTASLGVVGVGAAGQVPTWNSDRVNRVLQWLLMAACAACAALLVCF